MSVVVRDKSVVTHSIKGHRLESLAQLLNYLDTRLSGKLEIFSDDNKAEILRSLTKEFALKVLKSIKEDLDLSKSPNNTLSDYEIKTTKDYIGDRGENAQNFLSGVMKTLLPVVTDYYLGRDFMIKLDTEKDDTCRACSEANGPTHCDTFNQDTYKRMIGMDEDQVYIWAVGHFQNPDAMYNLQPGRKANISDITMQGRDLIDNIGEILTTAYQLKVHNKELSEFDRETYF